MLESEVKIIDEITDKSLGLSVCFDGIIRKNRKAVRIILQNGNGQIALVYTDKHGHHKLPGGGV